MTNKAKIQTERELREEISKQILHDGALGKLNMAVRDEDGDFPIVVALGHELLSAVLDRVDGIGGSANVFVQLSDGELAGIEVRASVAAAPGDGRENLGLIEQDVEIALLVAIAGSSENGIVARFKIDIPEYAGEAVVHREDPVAA
jgi:hypothetical protein